MKKEGKRRPAKLKINKIKAAPVRYKELSIRKAANGYVLVKGIEYNCSGPEHVFETDASLLKFLKKQFCEGYR